MRTESTNSPPRHFGPVLNKSLILFVIFLILFSFSFYASINFQGQNEATFTEGGINIAVFPLKIYVGSNQVVNPIVELILNNSGNTASSVAVLIKAGTSAQTTVIPLAAHQFERTYISLSSSFLEYRNIHVTFTSSGAVQTLSLSTTSSMLSYIAEIAFLFSLFIYALFFYYFKGKSRLLPLLILGGYFAISPFFGQRYDMYFMMVSPLEFIRGINPFIASGSLPGGIKWEYPPLFLYYGGLVDYIASIFHMIPAGNPVYPGVYWGYNAMAWRAVVSSDLPVMYFLLKIPFVISTFLIFLILDKKLPELNLGKLWLLNPAVISIGIIWGQLDVLGALMLVLSIIYLEQERTDMAILFAAVGTFIKIFPVFIIPIILLRSERKIRDFLILAVVTIFSIIPYVLSGNFIADISELVYSRSVPTFSHIFNSNGITWQVILTDLGVKSFPSLSLLLFVPFYLIILFYSARKKPDIKVLLIALFSGFFLTYNFVNPQYFIWVLPLFLLLRKTRFFITYSLIPCFYILFEYSLPYFVNPFISYNYYASYLGQMEHIRTYISGSYVFMGTFIAISTAIYAYTLIWAINGLRKRSGDDLPDFMVHPDSTIDS